MPWELGDRLTHRFNSDLGPGLVESIDGRTLVVEFPESDTVLRLAADSDALVPLMFAAGAPARVISTGEQVQVDVQLDEERVRLTDGRDVELADLWPVRIGESLVERLANGDVDPLSSFALRLDALQLAALREADGLGSFLGGRIHLFPHQLHAAERATRTDPTRWLLADEVGLGKTVEACLILNHLVRTGRAERALVIAPETLTVQWLGELWRKYHQVFVLFDDKRLADVEKDYGAGFNPFLAYRHTVVGLQFLQEHPRLTEQAVEAGLDLVIVDEAHHLRRVPGHPGNAAYRAVAPLAGLGRHLLLLTATPLEEDAFGFFRLLELLRPGEFASESIEERIASSDPLPPCTSSARRADLPGLPPRVGVAVDLSGDKGWGHALKLEAALRAEPAENTVARRRVVRRVGRLLASGAALAGVLGGDEEKLAKLAERADRVDPRVHWLAAQAPAWKEAGEKTLVFAAHRDSLELIKSGLRRDVQLRVGLFHEDLAPAQRDIEVAQFRLPDGPSMLVSTECGGEGRNFEFCTRLVLFDLPWNPVTVEQRIGRLDRIDRSLPVEIVYFRPASMLGGAVVALYESLGLFHEPLGGVERELAAVEAAVEALVFSDAEPDAEVLREVVQETRAAQDRVRDAALHELHREPYRAELAESILARVPTDLEELTREVIVAAAERLDLYIEEHRDGLRHSIELGTRARVESLPGVSAGSSFLGTFDRAEAVRDESIDFFSSGHPLVEGLLAHLDESPDGRVALLHLGGEKEGFGLLALYQQEDGSFSAVAMDLEGRERPDWAALLTRRPLRSRRVSAETWTRQPGWATFVRRLGRDLEKRGVPVALAAFRIGG